MHVVNIVVTVPVGAEGLDRIASVGSGVLVLDASAMLTLSAGVPVEPQDASVKARLDAMLADAEVIHGFIPGNIMARAPKLKWINAPSAGVDRFLVPDIVAGPVILTNSRGIHHVQMGEMAFEMILMLAKKAPFFFRMSQRREWHRVVPDILRGKTLAVLGLGAIGTEVARLGKAFGMRVAALDVREPPPDEGVDAFFPPPALKEILSQGDYVVVTLPLTGRTRNFIGREELLSMKPTAFLVNIARGGIVDEGALAAALVEERIAGAALDVFAKEPLPPESRLWDLPNVIISPHVAGIRQDYAVLAIDLFCENLRRYLDGRDMLNVVDKTRGY
jgi:D-2-hydroxyacid dehydrogenase (NADP+)